MDNQQRYTNICTAIDAIEQGAQEYSIGTRKVRKAELALLYKERDQIEEKLAQQNGNDNTFVASFYTR